MSFCLGRRISQAVLMAFALATLIYLYFCVRSFHASQLAASRGLQNQIRATNLEPQNPAYWRQLGEIRLYQENDPASSLPAFRRATELNPRDADAWIATAYALQLLGRLNEERDAIALAVHAEPRRLSVVWQAANLYAVVGDRDAMAADVSVLIEHDPVRASGAASLALRMLPNATALACDPRNPAQ
jgi:tetratricopeptide (TPR) repeat protein